MYPLGTWFVSGICVWISFIKETMMMMMMIMMMMMMMMMLIIIIIIIPNDCQVNKCTKIKGKLLYPQNLCTNELETMNPSPCTSCKPVQYNDNHK